jgi:hypothetical protein
MVAIFPAAMLLLLAFHAPLESYYSNSDGGKRKEGAILIFLKQRGKEV